MSASLIILESFECGLQIVIPLSLLSTQWGHLNRIESLSWGWGRVALTGRAARVSSVRLKLTLV